MNCRTCKHANLKAPGDTAQKMARLGFCVCNKGPKWEFRPGNHSCKQWEAK